MDILADVIIILVILILALICLFIITIMERYNGEL